MSILYSKPDLNYLAHYGKAHNENPPGRGSGRFEFGTGEHAFERADDFLSLYNKYKAQGLKETEIADVMGYKSTTDLRNRKTAEVQKQKYADRVKAQTLRAEGKTLQQIADIMGAKNESTVRSWLSASEKTKTTKIENTAEQLVEALKKHKYLDVGAGTEIGLGVSKTNMDAAVAMLKEQGYEVLNLQINQVALPGQKTTVKVLAPEGTTYKEAYNNTDKIGTLDTYSPDGGLTIWKPEYPQSISSKRVYVRYADEGGTDRDGSIELRRGVEDLSLGGNNYAQVRIAVDGKYYLKGVAVYSDNIPEGYDIVVNSNKAPGTPIYDPVKDKGWAKPMKLNKDGTINEDMPFGALIRANGQYHYGKNNEKLGAINIVRQEGDWSQWSNKLASQFLSKQDLKLIKVQLKDTLQDKKDEFNEIMSLTNPVVKQKLLNDFAESVDAAATNLKAKAIPGQLTKLLIPVPEMKDNEVYAPSYPNGTKVCLVRYPHGGTFEIPELIVNNKVKAAKEKLGTSPMDAIGINSKVAGILSGADFDGDTVICIPTKTGNRPDIKTRPPFEELKDFDTKAAYPAYPGMKRLANTGMEMGKITNLITDMTLQDAPDHELVRAVRHSMVIIDAEKHYLNYRQSEIDNGIAELRKKYQTGGASTLLSRSTKDIDINERKRSYKPNEDGQWTYTDTGRTYIDKSGKEKVATQKVEWGRYVSNAYDIAYGGSKDTAIKKEVPFAEYANSCKALANQARKEALSIDTGRKDPSASKVYATEVESLYSKLENAQKNAPRERQAQIYANNKVKMMVAANPDLKNRETKEAKEEYKKLTQYALAEGRNKYSANKKKVQVEITDKEWEAIQAHAISPTKLKSILANTDMDKVKQLSMPRTYNELSQSKQARIASLKASGKTTAEIAEIIGCSTTTVSKYS